jgi:hypothetical protein
VSAAKNLRGAVGLGMLATSGVMVYGAARLAVYARRLQKLARRVAGMPAGTPGRPGKAPATPAAGQVDPALLDTVVERRGVSPAWALAVTGIRAMNEPFTWRLDGPARGTPERGRCYVRAGESMTTAEVVSAERIAPQAVVLIVKDITGLVAKPGARLEALPR